MFIPCIFKLTFKLGNFFLHFFKCRLLLLNFSLGLISSSRYQCKKLSYDLLEIYWWYRFYRHLFLRQILPHSIIIIRYLKIPWSSVKFLKWQYRFQRKSRIEVPYLVPFASPIIYLQNHINLFFTFDFGHCKCSSSPHVIYIICLTLLCHICFIKCRPIWMFISGMQVKVRSEPDPPNFKVNTDLNLINWALKVDQIITILFNCMCTFSKTVQLSALLPYWVAHFYPKLPQISSSDQSSSSCTNYIISNKTYSKNAKITYQFSKQSNDAP